MGTGGQLVSTRSRHNLVARVAHTGLAMARMAVIVPIGLVIGLSAANAAGVASVEEVMPGCKNFLASAESNSTSRDPVLILATGRCWGIIEGILSAGYSLGIRLPAGPTNPSGPTIHQITRVIVNFVETHPAKMHEGFIPLAVQALWSAWRCKPGENPLGQRP